MKMIITVYPKISVMPAKKVILSGAEETLKPVITLLMGIYQLLDDVQQPVYGVPISGFQAQTKFKPQIMLWFLQEKQEATQGRARVDGEISFRLMPYESDTISETYIKQLAQKIKAKFASGQPFVWRKGKELYSYCDDAKGYRLNILSVSENEAKRVVEQVLDIQNHSPDWRYLNKNTKPQADTLYSETPGNTIILNKSIKKPRRRPLASVKFQYALLHLHGLPEPICLVDRSARFTGALEIV